MTTTKNLKVSVIIAAAGSGKRAGFNGNKLLKPLDGAPVLYHTLKKFNIPEIDEVIVASSERDFKEISALCKPFSYRPVRGGKTRTESVKRALKHVTGDIVLIHDGARPYVSRELILKCIDSVERFSSGVCAVPFTNSAAITHYGQITERLDRSRLYALQTPQGFLTEDIVRAYELAGDAEYTDDSAVYGEFIAPPRVVEGEESNVKLTYTSDFTSRQPLLPSSACSTRIGFGCDVHAFGDGDGLTLCGVKIPFNKRLIAHSDGDAAFHAVCDALLSAAGLDDIGHYFPDNDPEYEGADSGGLLKKVIELIKNEGFEPVNISVTIQAEQPKLAPYIDSMRQTTATLCGIGRENVAVAAGTCEKLGFVGEGLGITAYCAVMLKTVK